MQHLRDLVRDKQGDYLALDTEFKTLQETVKNFVALTPAATESTETETTNKETINKETITNQSTEQPQQKESASEGHH
jgi:hypothetical protein